MKLLHQEPLIFAKEIIEIDSNTAKVLCEFQQLPTIGMFIEAAAQATASFFQELDIKSGYLAQANNIELLDEIVEKKYIIELEKQIELENMVKYSFSIKSFVNENSVSQGEVTVAIETV